MPGPHDEEPGALASFVQIRLVRLSVTVWSPVSAKRVVGQDTPFCKSPSSPVAYLVVCPVFGRQIIELSNDPHVAANGLIAVAHDATAHIDVPRIGRTV